MAKCEVIREVPPPPPPVKGYLLELTPGEATALAAVCLKIGGCPTGSRRRFFDSIARSLDSVGVSGSTHDVEERTAAIYFRG